MAIDSSDNYINPSDVESEADEYRDSIESKEEEIDEVRTELNDAIDDEDEEAEEDAELKLDTLLDELSELEDEAKDIFELESACNDYASGETLINEDIFAEYIEELAVDCGDIKTNSWLYSYIDWERVAEDSKMDYTTITWRGQDFYVRS
jgi:hypothetical protein